MAELFNNRDFPPGGWKYIERATGVRFTAGSLDELVSAVEVHRRYKGLDPETARRDVEDQICLRLSPNECRARPGEIYEPVKDKAAALTTDMVKSLNSAVWGFVTGGAKFVDQTESEARAAVCRTCPFNIQASTCSCHAAYKAIELVLPRRTEGVSVCSACGCSLHAKVLLPGPVLAKSTAPGTVFPPWCWQRNHLQGIQKPDTEA